MLALKAQDVHFSHIHATPLLVNPALTGVFEGDVRVSANYRSQWKSVTTDYRTLMASADMKLIEMNRGNSFWGLGLNLYADKAGDLDFSTNQMQISLSMMQSLSRHNDHFIAGSFQIGHTWNQFNPLKAIAFDEDPLLNNADANRTSYTTFNAGALWYYTLPTDDYFYLGSSLYNINTPDVSFSDLSFQVGGEHLYRRLMFHGGGSLSFMRRHTLMPNFILMGQGPHREFTIGTFWKYRVIRSRNSEPLSVALGGWLRWYTELSSRDIGTDAFVAALRLDSGPFTVTFSYDMNVSKLTRVSYGRGGPELSLIYVADIKRPSRVRCPMY